MQEGSPSQLFMHYAYAATLQQCLPSYIYAQCHSSSLLPMTTMFLQWLFVLSSLLPLALGSYVARQASTPTGGSVCTSLMCITATVNTSTVEYVLQSKGSAALGWMAMGFGTQMAQSPMVVMWPNSDGSVTLSQRIASGHVMPTVQASPPRVATFLESATDLNATPPKMAFTIPKNSDTVQNIIWAFGTTNPGSSAVDASFTQHLESGATTIDLTGTLSSTGASTPTGSSTSTSTVSNGSSSIKLSGYRCLIVAHAIVVVGFLSFYL